MTSNNMKNIYRVLSLSLSLAVLLVSHKPVLADEESGDGGQTLPPVKVTARPEPPELAPEAFIPRFSPDLSPVVQPTTARSNQPDEGCTKTEHPVVIKTGNKVRVDADWTTQFPAPLHINRSYNATTWNPWTGVFGRNWYSNLDAHLTLIIGAGQVCSGDCAETGSPENDRVIRSTSDGSAYTYVWNGVSWVGTIPGSNSTLTWRPSSKTWLMQYSNRIAEVYDVRGRIKSIRDAFGVGQDFYYVEDNRYGKLAQVTHTNGARFTLEWTGDKMTAIVDPSGARYTYGYNANGMLATVTSDNSTPTTVTRYQYQQSDPFGLLNVSYDDILYAESDYYADGKAFHSGLAGGVERDTFMYGTEPSGRTYTQVINAAGAAEKYTYAPISTEIRLISVERVGTVGCPASNNKYEYDSSGTMTATEDFNGIRTCYQLDAARQEETERVEGLPSGFACSSVIPEGSPLPPGARKITQKLHPDWALITKKTTPGRLETWVYNGMPDPTNGGAVANCIQTDPAFPENLSLAQPEKPIAVLCKEVAEATTDDTGTLGLNAGLNSAAAKRINSYTYDQFGRVKTFTDPRGKTTSYEYYTSSTFNGNVGGYAGQLKSIKNAKLQVTAFQYDRSGRILSSQDPNQVRSLYQYWANGDLKSHAVGNDTPTTFDYFRWGLLRKTTLPDGSYLEYDYDPARRLIGAKDSLGNYATYAFQTDAVNQEHTRVTKIVANDGLVSKLERNRFDARGRLRNVNGAASPAAPTNATSTSATARQPSNVSGTTVTFNANVTGASKPTGFVKFTATASAPGYAPIEMGQCAIAAGYCSLDFVFTVAEEWSVIATYLGDSNNAPSSSPAIVVPIMRTIIKPPPPASSR